MYVEIPQPKKCCFVLPLRTGLLAWGYIKFLFSFGAAAFFVFGMMIAIYWGMDSWLIITIMLLIFLAVDISFNILFIISAHGKNWKHLRAYYRYAIVILCLDALVLLGSVGMGLFVVYGDFYSLQAFIGNLSVQFSQLALQVYFVILLRSEIMKLRDNEAQLQFTNHVPEPNCTAIYPTDLSA